MSLNCLLLNWIRVEKMK